MKNYESERDLKTAVDILALSDIQQILKAADDYFDDQLQVLGITAREIEDAAASK